MLFPEFASGLKVLDTLSRRHCTILFDIPNIRDFACIPADYEQVVFQQTTPSRLYYCRLHWGFSITVDYTHSAPSVGIVELVVLAPSSLAASLSLSLWTFSSSNLCRFFSSSAESSAVRLAGATGPETKDELHKRTENNQRWRNIFPYTVHWVQMTSCTAYTYESR